jgi:hypothetical protein
MTDGTVNGNGKSLTMAVLGALGRIVAAVGIGGGAVLGAVYGYATLCNRVEQVEAQVAADRSHIEQIDKSYVELSGDLREIKTDLKWIRRQFPKMAGE